MRRKLGSIKFRIVAVVILFTLASTLVTVFFSLRQYRQAAVLLDGQRDGSGGLFQQIGLYNVHRRIQYEFGPDYGLSVESEPGVYTRVTVRLPFPAEDPEKEEDAL